MLVMESFKNAFMTSIYAQDYYLWLEKTARLLRDGRMSELDVPNLIEEIEDMGRSEKRALRSNLIIETFPDQSPFAPEETLNPDYLP